MPELNSCQRDWIRKDAAEKEIVEQELMTDEEEEWNGAIDKAEVPCSFLPNCGWIFLIYHSSI